MGRKFVLGNPKTCVGCKTCMTACLVKHFAREDAPVSRLNVVSLGERTVSLSCRHCEDAPCVSACPVGALYFDQTRVAVSMHKCIGCSGCISGCPYGAVSLIERPDGKRLEGMVIGNTLRQVVIKCDLCYDRENGPACIEACTSSSLRLVDQDELNLRENLSKAAKSAIPELA